jgi:hypothetical protein
MASTELPHKAPQQVIAFCKYGETAQQALAIITRAINDYMHGEVGDLAVETISHTVTQLAEPVPLIAGMGNAGPGHFVVTALVTFRHINGQVEAGDDPVG